MKRMDKIVLLGYMASGKSTIGKALADKRDIKFIDLDHYIAEKEKLDIAEIFNRKGESYFREKELHYLIQILQKKDSFVLALGGGTPQVAGIIEVVKKQSLSVYLKASPETLYYRLAPLPVERPLLTHITSDFLQDYIALHLKERAPFYEQAAIILNTDNREVDEVVEMINTALEIYSK